MFGRKKKTKMTWAEVKKVFVKQGDLPVTWECGNDESLVSLHGWGKWKKNSPHQVLSEMLCDRIVDELNLPNAGPLMDEGEGRVFYDPKSKRLKITYSSKCVVYEMYLEHELKPGYENHQGVKLSLPELNADDFRFYGEIDNADQIDDWFSMVVAKPTIDATAGEVLKKALEASFQQFFAAFVESKTANTEPNEGEVYLKGCDFEGTWSLAEKTLTYDLHPSLEIIASIATNKTATLA